MTRISASAADAIFRVDGQAFTGAAVFTWPAGSKHTLAIDPWQYASGFPNTRYTFQHWNSSAGQLPSSAAGIAITADPSISWYAADLTTEYTLALIFFQCPSPPCDSPGTVWVNQTAYSQDTTVWIAAGSAVTLDASPNQGFVFAGWSPGGSLAPIYSFVVKAAMTIYPRFALARGIQLATSPPGLQLLADRAPVATPVVLDWGLDTVHTLSAVSPQFDQQGKRWVFRSWSDGGPITHSYQVQAGATIASVVAEFVPAVAVVLATDPPGLTVNADGNSQAAPQYLTWAAGDVHTVAVSSHQMDAAGGPWTFRSWSNNAPNPQTIQVTDTQVDSGIRLTATFDPLSRIRLESTPTGLPLVVDGAACQTPCEFERPVGATVRLSAPPSIGAADGSRLDFASWDGTEGPTLTTSAGYRKVTAHYGWSYRLTLSMQPAGAGTWQLSVPSADGFYPAGTALSIAASAAAGMRFRSWAGDLSGSAIPATLLMNAPHAVQAIFDQVPETVAPRVGNAAGETSVGAVAAGSIAALYGSALAGDTASAQTDPLPQSLAGVSLSCSNHLLPLLYVSPQQINFQVPSDLVPGPYTLELNRGNSPKVQVGFTVVRDAPGLFLLTHLDGTVITSDSPARVGESILAYGTGFGPYIRMPLDGFRVPAIPPFPLADGLVAVLQGHSFAPDLAVAVAGAVGVAVAQVRIPADLDLTMPTSLAVQVGGNSSNSLPLPLK